MYILKEYNEEVFLGCSWHNYMVAAIELKKAINKHQPERTVKIYMVDFDFEGKIQENEAKDEVIWIDRVGREVQMGSGL